MRVINAGSRRSLVRPCKRNSYEKIVSFVLFIICFVNLKALQDASLKNSGWSHKNVRSQSIHFTGEPVSKKCHETSRGTSEKTKNTNRRFFKFIVVKKLINFRRNWIKIIVCCVFLRFKSYDLEMGILGKAKASETLHQFSQSNKVYYRAQNHYFTQHFDDIVALFTILNKNGIVSFTRA